MTGVETIARNRFEHFQNGKGIKRIARELGIARDTVRKVLRSGATQFSYRRSSTLRSDSGYLTYIITTRRMTSGELLKYRNGLLIAQAYHGQRHRQHLV